MFVPVCVWKCAHRADSNSTTAKARRRTYAETQRNVVLTARLRNESCSVGESAAAGQNSGLFSQDNAQDFAQASFRGGLQRLKFRQLRSGSSGRLGDRRFSWDSGNEIRAVGRERRSMNGSVSSWSGGSRRQRLRLAESSEANERSSLQGPYCSAPAELAEESARGPKVRAVALADARSFSLGKESTRTSR